MLSKSYDECLRTSMVLKFLEYISYIKIKKSGPSSGSLHEKKCILLSVTARSLTCKILKKKKKKWTHPRFLHRGPKKAVEQDSDVHFDLT